MRIASAAAATLGAVVLASTLVGSDDHPEAKRVRPAPPAKPARGPVNPPVVILLLDEFPVDMMRLADGDIDPVRYPNFARLAEDSYWFPNATTIYDATPKAIPVILDGRLPEKGSTGSTRYHPRSLYTILGERRYRIYDSEEATTLCPDRYCPGGSGDGLSIMENLSGGRERRLDRWIRSVNARQRTLYVKHALLPHVPWIFLPSGRQHRRKASDPVRGLASPPSFGDPDLTKVNMLRQLLQIGFVDRQLGRLRAQMERAGMWKRSLVVVTADHGYAWQVGVESRRRTNDSNIHMIAPVPLFMKVPGQRRGRTIDSYVRTLDVLPTITDILNISPGYDLDGHSAFSRAVRRRRTVRVIERFFRGDFEISARRMERRRRAFIRRKLRLFGAGPVEGEDWRLYRGIGPHRELLGQQVAELALAARGDARADIAKLSALSHVDLDSQVVPVHIAGTIANGRRHKRDLAVAVNGSIEAVGRSFFLDGSKDETFTFVVPEWVLRQGRNDVRVFEVREQGGQPRLLPLS